MVEIQAPEILTEYQCRVLFSSRWCSVLTLADLGSQSVSNSYLVQRTHRVTGYGNTAGVFINFELLFEDYGLHAD
jgi:hypothetical protein